MGGRSTHLQFSPPPYPSPVKGEGTAYRGDFVNHVIGGALLGIAKLFGQKSPLRACSSPSRW